MWWVWVEKQLLEVLLEEEEEEEVVVVVVGVVLATGQFRVPLEPEQGVFGSVLR